MRHWLHQWIPIRSHGKTMTKHMVLAAMTAILASACSPGGSSSASDAAQGGGLSTSECQAMVDKSRELSGMPADAFVEAAEQAVQQCDASTSVSRGDYDCAMAASTMQDFQNCRIDVLN
ncbi:MAG: hypothetical protein ACT4NL_02960 [Pseudomarimonas sp.]